MTRFVFDILEKRREPEMNPKVDVIERLKQIWEEAGSEKLQFFVSFRSINKLGVNPASQYNTPNGIYAYPLRHIMTRIEEDQPRRSLDNNLTLAEFAADEPYIWVFKTRVADKTLYLQHCDEALYDQIKEKISVILVHQTGGISKKQLDMTVDTAETSAQNWLVEKRGFDFSDRSFWGGMIWALAYYICQTFTPNNSKPHLFWASLFRKLGYEAVIDDGSGIIYQDEPTQAVFFTKESIEEVELLENKQRPPEREAAWRLFEEKWRLIKKTLEKIFPGEKVKIDKYSKPTVSGSRNAITFTVRVSQTGTKWDSLMLTFKSWPNDQTVLYDTWVTWGKTTMDTDVDSVVITEENIEEAIRRRVDDVLKKARERTS